MRLYELHQVDEDVGERVAKAVVALAMAAAAGAVALGFTSKAQPDVEAETQRLMQNATANQIARIRAALLRKSKDDLRRELDALRAQSAKQE